MLKWAISRSLSTSESTPRASITSSTVPRRPFRDLSNTPPASATRTTRNVLVENSTRLPVSCRRRRRRSSQGSDNKTSIRVTKLNSNSSLSSDANMNVGKNRGEQYNQSSPPRTFEKSPMSRNFDRNTPNIDPEIVTTLSDPIEIKQASILTLSSSNEIGLLSGKELPQNILNEARANLQSHVSDFFRQISMATSPEDAMEVDTVPMIESTVLNCASNDTCREINLASKITGIARIYARRGKSYRPEEVRKSVDHFLGKSSDPIQVGGSPKFQNMDNTVTEIIRKEQKINTEKRSSVDKVKAEEKEEEKECLSRMSMDYEDSEGIHNNSSVSSASQLLEDPSPTIWSFTSPMDDLDGECTLKRRGGIRRRKRRPRDEENEDNTDERHGSESKRMKRTPANGLIEAINRNAKRLALETDLDSSLDLQPIEKMTLEDKVLESEMETEEITDDSRGFEVSNSVPGTPEVSSIVTARRCLRFSPESETSRSNRSGSIEIEYSLVEDRIRVKVIRCKDLKRTYEGPIHAYVKASLRNGSGEGVVKRTAVHRATPNPVFQETLVLPCPAFDSNPNARRIASLDIAVWHRDRRARRSELLGCMTLPLPLSQDKEAAWHPLEAGSGRDSNSCTYGRVPQDRGVTPPLSKNGEPDNDNPGAEDLTYLRHLELEPIDPLTGAPLHPGFTARGGRTPCTITRRLIRHTSVNQVAWGFSLSWGKPPRVERVDPGSLAERYGLRPGDYVVFVGTTNVVTKPRDETLGLIQAARNQLVLEVYRKAGSAHMYNVSGHRPASVNVTLQRPTSTVGINGQQQHVAFSAEVFPNLASDAPPEEELALRENRYWSILKSGQARFMTPLIERRDVLSVADYTILFQNLEELLKMSEEIREENVGVESYLRRVPRITAAYRRYLSGLQRACCLLVALRRNSSFAKLVSEPAVPHRKRPDLTGVLVSPLEHYREMTRLVGLASPRNCQLARDLAQGYREATANAGVMEPPRDTGRPLLSLQEVESRLVFARCKPFTLAMPGRQWLFGGALAKVEGRTRLQPFWALLLTDLLVFARVSRDRVLFVTEEPLRLSSIAEACFTVRKRPTEFRLQISVNPNGNNENGHDGITSNSGGCSPHSRPRRRVLVLRAPSPELKAVWHNLLQRQIIYVNTGCGGTSSLLESPDESPVTGSNVTTIREPVESPKQIARESERLEEEREPPRTGRTNIEKELNLRENDHHHLAQWLHNSRRIPPPDHDVALEEWPVEESARTSRGTDDEDDDEEDDDDVARNIRSEAIEIADETNTGNSDADQRSTASSASLSTVKSNGVISRKNGSRISSKDDSSGSINMCRRCHRSGCPTPPLQRDPFSPLPPKISILPPTPDLCTRHRSRNGPSDSPNRGSPNYTPADGNTEDGSEDDLDCDGEPPYRALRRFGTMSSLDQDDEPEDQGDQDNREDAESPPPLSGLRAWTSRASNYVVSKMVLLEQLGEGVGGCLLHPPPVPPERTEFSLDPNDEEGTTSGATSGDDIWGTPTSGGPDDESFTVNSPPPQPSLPVPGGIEEEDYVLNSSTEDDPGGGRDFERTEDTLHTEQLELSMDQLLGGGSSSGARCFLGRRRLEPLLEEEDSPGSGKHQVGWW